MSSNFHVAPKQPLTWIDGVMEAASALPLHPEEGRLEARGVGLRSERGSWMVNPAWTGSDSSLCNRETEDPSHTGAKN